MIAAAQALFLERGYDAVSLGEIVRRSGGSLSTLYELFENKPGLLAAIVADHRFERLERLDAIIARDDPPAIMLDAIARTLHVEFLDPATIGLMRLVMGEMLRDPAIAQSIYQTVHLPSVARLTRLFARWAEAGRADIPDPELAAQFFLSLVVHRAQNRALYGEPDQTPLQPLEHCLHEATALFLRGYSIDRAAGS